MRYFYFSLGLLFSVQLSAQSWQITSKALVPERVTNNAVVEGYVNGIPHVYTFGGIDSTKLYTGIHLRSYRYNTQTDVWDTLPPLPDTLGKIAAGASRVRDKLYIIGGYHVFANGGEASSDKIHIFDPASNNYLADGAPIPVPIDDQVQAVWRDSLIYVVTGWSNTANVPNVQIYDPSTNTWQNGTSVPNNNAFKSFGASGAIVGDTIYYFGGASMSGSFNIQGEFRRGIIDPNNPTQITWATFMWGGQRGYRMAATTAYGKVIWLGGANKTYNYNGLAYDGTGGVPPLGRSLWFDRSDNTFKAEFGYAFPMDLRGLGDLHDTLKYTVGGMEANQLVSRKTLRLALEPDSVRFVNTTVLPTALPLALTVAPNPTRGYLQVQLEQAAPWSYSVTTLAGVRLQTGRYEEKQAQLDLNVLVTGVYILEVQQGARKRQQLIQIE